jgi:putative transposase
MPEHVHLLLSEPERSNLAVVLQMLKQVVSQKLNEHATIPFWQPRYYDFNVRREQKMMEKLDYIRKPHFFQWGFPLLAFSRSSNVGHH